MRVAAVQMTSTRDVPANLREAGRLVADAARQGAKLVVLPENFSFLGATDADRVAAVEPFGDGPAQRFLAETAERLGIWIVGGTIPIRDRGDGGDRASSRSLLVGPDGRVAAHYDKIHLFDVDIPGREERYRESATVVPGAQPMVTTTPLGRLGMAVCYDVRFPELFRVLQAQGAEVFSLPSAFTAPTGRAHWELLVRARAVENLCYVLAPAQSGTHDNGRETYGDSMIVDPWGHVVARVAEAGPGLAVAEIDRTLQHELRGRFPALSHRKFQVTSDVSRDVIS